MNLDARAEPQPPTATPSFAMLRTLGGIATISGLLVALSYQITLPIITENQRVRTERAVLRVIPGAISKRDFMVRDQGIESAGQGGQGEPLYAAYAADGTLKGVAFIGTGSGYGGTLKVLLSYDPEGQRIVGSKVLQSNETPGFGDKLDNDPGFLRNMEALDVRLNAEGSALANPVVTVMHGTKTQPWQIDAISGATISSKAMGQAVNSAAQRMAPMIRRDLTKLMQVP